MVTEDDLSNNEKKVLSMLLEDGRISDTSIALEIKMSPQGARKIRKKLEKDYIREYRTIVDYKKIGIRVFAIAQVKVIDKAVLLSKNIIGAFEINEADISHVFFLGFGSLDELDSYKRWLIGKADLKKIYVLSNSGLLKNSPVGLIREMLG